MTDDRLSGDRSRDAIDEYIAQARADVRDVLSGIRATIHRAVPDATECIGYKMPAFRLQKQFIYFAAFKKHIGIYPPLNADAALVAELAPYRGEKGNLQFPLNEPVPYALIERLALALSREHGR